MKTMMSGGMGRMAALGGMLALSIVAASSDAVAGDLAGSARNEAAERSAAIRVRAEAGVSVRGRVEVQVAPLLIANRRTNNRWVEVAPIPSLAGQLLLDGGLRRRLLVALVGD